MFLRLLASVLVALLWHVKMEEL